MKKLIFQLTAFVGILIVILNVIGLYLPEYHGNNYYQEKYDYFSRRIEYNTIILGSSRMFRQFDPSRLSEAFTTKSIRAYNLAAPATHHPEFYFLYEQLLEELPENKVRYAFIELEPLNEIAIKNIATARNAYWIDLEKLTYTQNYVRNSDYSTFQAVKFNASYALSYLWKVLGFQNPKQFFKRDSEDLKGLYYNNGFKSLDSELEKKDNQNWIKRRSTFLNDTLQIQSRNREIREQLRASSLKSSLNNIHLEKINSLITRSKNKNIHLIFVVPPKLPKYREIYALLEHIPSEHFIDISDPEKYPDLYFAENTFDVGHLNSNGAKLFTEYLIEEIRRKNIFH